MTFTDIKTAVKDLCLLSSTDADARVGRAINRHYKRVTALLGLDATRRVTRSQTTTNGVQTVTFTSIESIDLVVDTTDSNAIRELTKVSFDELKTTQPGTGQATTWAVQSVTATTVTILLDTLPQTTYTLQATGTATVSDLSGSDVPVIAESYHDILTCNVVAEELLKKEKIELAREFATGDEENPGRAEKLLSAYRHELAEQSTATAMRQGSRPSAGAGGSGGSGSGSVGGTAYTQTALLTFDRGAGIVPFAVAKADAPYVVNLGAEFLGNITTDRLIGRDTAGTGETEQLTVGNGLEFTGSGGIGIANDGVTYARMQNVSATDKVLGRSTAGAGDVEEIACTAAARSILDDASVGAIRTTLGVGTGDSPTFAGLTLSSPLTAANGGTGVATASANTVFAGPTSGAAAAPTFRTLAGADLTSAGGVRVLDRDVTQAEVVNTVTETTVYSFSVPGGTLSSNKALRLTVLGDYLNNSGAGAAITMRIKYGVTAFQAFAPSPATSANRRNVLLELFLSAQNATNAQWGMSRVVVSNAVADGSATSATDIPEATFRTTGAEDSTAAKTLSVTIEHTVASANISFRAQVVFLELLE